MNKSFFLAVTAFCFSFTFAATGPGHVNGEESCTYTISYSPGTFFHQLVRNKTREVYEHAEIKATFIPLPHNRSLLSANDGTVDGDVGRVPSVENKYPNLVRVNEQIMSLNGAAYTINPNITSYSENLLESVKVGHVLGVRWPQKLMKGRSSQTARDYPALFEMLLSGRVDIILATEASAEHVLAKLGSRGDNIRLLQPYILSAPIFHYLHTKNSSIIPALEKSIRELRAINKDLLSDDKTLQKQ